MSMACAPLRTARSRIAKLFLDTAVELAVILVPAAGGQQRCSPGNCSRNAAIASAPLRDGQEIQAEFKEQFARFGFAPGVLKQRTERLAGPTQCRCGEATSSAPSLRKDNPE